MRIPVYGGLVLVRQINSSMIATKTSALNMFGFSVILGQYPIDVHYVHTDSIGSCAINYARGF